MSDEATERATRDSPRHERSQEGANPPRVLVTGATGKLGRLVVDSLLKKLPASQVAAAVRSPEKAADLAARGVAVRKADYTQPATLDAAFRGVERLVFISASEVGKRLEQHRAVVDAAKRAGVKLVVYTSILKADRAKTGLAAEHRATEQLLAASGVPHVCLRNGWYIENYSENLAGPLHAGVLLGAAGKGKVSPAARRDYAEAAAVVVTGEGHAGKAYELAGDAAYTLAELAAVIARASGKPVAYQDLPEKEYSATLQKFGVPGPIADMLADADVGLGRGELEDSGGDLRRLIGRPTTPLADVIAAAVRAG